MLAVHIQNGRTLTPDEIRAFERACNTVNQALDNAVNLGVIDVR